MKWRNVARPIKQPIKWQNNSAMQPKHSGYPTKQPGFFSSNQVGFNKKVASHYCVRQPFRYSIWSLIQYRSSVSSFVPSAIPMNISASSFCSNWNWYPFHLSSSCVTMAPIRLLPSINAWLDANPNPIRAIFSMSVGKRSYFHQTGEIQIGWAVDGGLDMDAVCEQKSFP